ncbi:MAG: UDP-2,3-diacylglucosamine diphosphatase [Cyclobacteriaceae bacterium]
MDEQFKNIPKSKKIYLASDFHLGAPDLQSSQLREKKIVRWLSSIEKDAVGIILVGDIFDFWFEYRHAIPKGFVRFIGKIAELRDRGIPVLFFTGNHDIWMADYFEKEMGVQIYSQPRSFLIGSNQVYIGHGDGLGPGDCKFKFYKKIFTNPLAQWAFRWLHPDLGIGLAKKWSNSSKEAYNDLPFQEDKEWLIIHSKEIEQSTHHDYYIYGHRHLFAEYDLSPDAKYINLGEWMSGSTYLTIDSISAKLSRFEE